MKILTLTIIACLIATSASAEDYCSLLDGVRENIQAFEQAVERYERSVSSTEGDCTEYGSFSKLSCEQEEKDKRYAEAYRANLEQQRQKLKYWERLCAERGN